MRLMLRGDLATGLISAFLAEGFDFALLRFAFSTAFPVASHTPGPTWFHGSTFSERFISIGDVTSVYRNVLRPNSAKCSNN